MLEFITNIDILTSGWSSFPTLDEGTDADHPICA